MKLPVQGVWRRHVFFLSGFDPKGASHYHALYKTQAQKQAAVNGMDIHVGPRLRVANGNSTWTIDAVAPDAKRCETTYEFSRWDDIVRRHWPRSTWRLLLDSVLAYALMLSSGEIPTVWQLARKTLVSLFYPLVVLGGAMVLSTGLSVGVAIALHGSGVSWHAALTTAMLLLILGLWSTQQLEAKLNTSWLVRIFSFAGKQAYGKLPELEARLDDLAEQLKNKRRLNDVDEILVVGFSVGSILAVSLLARALCEADADEPGVRHPSLSLLTLGHCIPMLGLLPQAVAFRKEIGTLAQNKNLRWMDFSSRTDWGSFALVDPVEACKVVLPNGPKCNPEMRSPRFHTMFAPAVYAGLNRNKRRMHLQYLMSGDLTSDYDYFAITAGVLTLDDRYTTKKQIRP